MQPGYVDTLCNFATPKTVATFSEAPSILSNVDAAIAEVVPGAVDPSGGIIGLGGLNPDGSYITAPPAGTTAAPAIGMLVAKSGRTTGLSCGVVEAINGTILIDLPAECGNPSDETVLFQNQVVLNNIVRPGDSGSLVVEAATAQPIALVAGLSSDGQFATANPAYDVISGLNAASESTLSFVGGDEHPVRCSSTSVSGAQSSQQVSHVPRENIPPLASEEVTRAFAIQSRHEKEVMRNSAVLGVAVGRSVYYPKRAALLVFVERGLKQPSLPAKLDGLAVQVVFTGRFGTGVLKPKRRSLMCSRGLPL